jgi:hypothetical protein
MLSSEAMTIDSSNPLDAFGGAPERPIPEDGGPLTLADFEWEWIHPLRAILKTSGWTIDDVVSDPRTAIEVKVHWKLFKMSQKMAAEREMRAERRHRRGATP